MTITMKDEALSNIKEIKNLLKFSGKVEFKRTKREEAYHWMERTMERFEYCQVSKENKGIIKQYLKKTTGYPRRKLHGLSLNTGKPAGYKSGYIRGTDFPKDILEKTFDCLQKRMSCIIFPTE